MRKEVYKAETPRGMEAIGERIAEGFRGGEVILLSGDLGAGKTVLAKGIAKGLGIAEEVTSPTFAIHNVYQGRLTLNHFDFYRLESEEEAMLLGLEEIIGAEDSVAVCEWWKNVSGLFLRLKTIRITVEGSGNEMRTVTVEE